MSVITVDNRITIALSVKDRHASADWYAKMLGFKLRMHIDEAGWSEMDTNTPGVVLGFGEQAEPSPGNAIPVFGVSDVHDARTALEAAGVQFDGETMTVKGMVSLATFFDPDGNALMIAEDLMQAD